ncbi:RHS repeat-associated core domain-containing protein [Nonomuraea sp. NPDC050783]|uniref:RHS repeat-associated core domain-containing protein n=1 Tax=Nonomuraea sp. NPDC050783 TaxID=3154634 RepID=UPI003467E410
MTVATAAEREAADLPVAILRPAGTDEVAGKVRVRMLARADTAKLGANGLAFTVARSDAARAGRVAVRLDYGAFAQAFGGAYGARLRLHRLPGCALTTPSTPGCRTAVPLQSVNNPVERTLTAETDVAPGAGTLLVAAAAEAGSQGDFKATSLAPSATWKAGGNTGDFTWSYPLRVPPVPGDLAPDVALMYSSGSVDGRTGNTNGQPSWIGQGFELWPGFIERNFKSCEDDGAPKDEWGNSPGDQCWGYDNATVTWNGKGGELVQAADGSWRLADDDGTTFEKLTGGANGDDNGEYWKVTDTTGVQYFFGRNKLPKWSEGKPETGSTWTMPVYGDDSGEPCHRSSFAESWCQQAYRWNLDYVVDPRGNAIVYTYLRETNHYGRNLKPADETPYTRGGYLTSISYGLRSDALYATAPARVLFDVSERCIPDAAFSCAADQIESHPQYWWDVPWDLKCDSGQDCEEDHGAASPTFWSRKRLTKVRTQVIKADGSGYRDVDSWSLTHKWGLADVERDLLLEAIQHTGNAGATPVSLPPVRLDYVQLENRVDKTGDDILSYIRYRLSAVYDESGGQLDISYSGKDCAPGDVPTPETNTRRCFPVIWQPPGREDRISDWFHKYVVTSVIQTDRTGLSPDMATKYLYLGGAAWHFDDDDGLTKEKYKTWSQWRGYGQVRTLTGGYDSPSTQDDTFYLRGMDGDRLNRDGGAKRVSVSDGEGGTLADHAALAGFELRRVQYEAPGGAVHLRAVNTPWRVQTASRTRSWGTVTANVVDVDVTRTWTAKDGGGWIETKTDTDRTSSGPGAGRPQTVNDLGDLATAADDTCTRTTYADNTAAHMTVFPQRVETVAVACTAQADRSTQVVSDVRSYYDGGALGAPPSRGDLTSTEKIAEYNGTTATYVTEQKTIYDGYGRPTSVTDALGQAATTAYTDMRGLTTRITSTSAPATPGNAATAFTTSQELDPAWGEPTVTTDANNLKTELVRDALGRLCQVWLPNLSRGGDKYPNYEFDYQVAENQIVAVTTRALTAEGGQRLDRIELKDGWLRDRQTQAPGPEGRLITDTFYDERGQIAKSYASYSAAGDPVPALFGVGTPGNVEAQTHVAYDGLGRRTVERLVVGNGSQAAQEKWRTTYTYGGGNRTTVTPPSGGVPTTEITNADGKVIERRQYTGGVPAGPYQATAYTYTPQGEIASVTDPSGNIFTATYDLRGRRVATSDPDKGTTSYAFDDLDRQISVTDARGQKVVTRYDGLGRVLDTRRDSAEGPLLTSYTYDTVTWGKGKQATATRHHDGAAYVSKVRRYDKLGRIEVTDLTIPAAQGGLAGTYVSNSTYGLDGTLRSQSAAAVGGLPAETLLYDYDAWLRPTRLTSGQETYVNDTRYTLTGKPMLRELGDNGKHAWQTYTYQYGTQRLTGVRTSRQGIDGYDHDATYTYTDAGSITAVSDVSRDGTDTQCFSYDGLQRLTQAWTQSTTGCAEAPSAAVISGVAPYWHSYGYDTAGNRTAETRHATGAGRSDTTRAYAYATPGSGNRLNRVTQTGGDGARTDTYAYDAAGNTTRRSIGATTQTLDWGPSGELARLTEGDDVTGFVYAADGSRLLRKDPDGTTLYLAGTELRLNAGATAPIGTRYYVHGDQTVAMRTPIGVTYLTSDHQGTAQVAVKAADLSSSTRRTTPFGGRRGIDVSASWPNDKGFVGGTEDPTGLTHLGAREYDPDTGRFISVDPLMDPDDPQQMNGYTYANNNPVTNSDPNGLMACPSPSWCQNVTPRVTHKVPRKNWAERNHPGIIMRGRIRARAPIHYPREREVGASGIRVPEYLDIERFRTIFWKKYADASSGRTYTDENFVYEMELVAAMNTCREMKECLHSDWYIDLLSAFAWMNLDGMVGSRGMRTGKMREGAKAAKSRNAHVVGSKKILGICSSFVPGTAVLMADGRARPIEDLKTGDEVVATDPETGRTETKTVLATITSRGVKQLVQITLGTAGPMTATDTHPFWVAGDVGRWVKAIDLQPGMWLRTSAGTYVQIAHVATWTAPDQRVHNLRVADYHTYYVLTGAAPGTGQDAGAADVLVHNAGGDRCGDPPPTLDATGKLHSDQPELPDHVPSYWTRQELEDLADDLRKSISTRKLEQQRLGEGPSHRRRIHEEERMLRRVEKKLSGS